MTIIKEAVNQQFSKVADNYRTSKVHAQGQDLSQIVELVQQTSAPAVLDAGCGAGHTALAVAPHSHNVIAFDLSQEMLALVRQQATERGLSNLQTRQGDVEDLPFEAEAFDIVTSRYSAHHWPNPQAAVQEFKRVLKPGGRFILSDIIALEEPAKDSFLQTLEVLRDPTHVRDHSLSQWQAMFEQAGLKPDVNFTWRLLLNFNAWVERMDTPELNIAMLKALYDGASAEIRAWLDVQPDYSFSIDGALLVGQK